MSRKLIFKTYSFQTAESVFGLRGSESTIQFQFILFTVDCKHSWGRVRECWYMAHVKASYFLTVTVEKIFLRDLPPNWFEIKKELSVVKTRHERSTMMTSAREYCISVSLAITTRKMGDLIIFAIIWSVILWEWNVHRVKCMLSEDVFDSGPNTLFSGRLC